MSNIVSLHPYEVYTFDWGSAVKKKNGKWERLFFFPDGQEMNVEGISVELHDNGIEFC